MSKFITFEGIEGSGKSTQSKMIIDHLRSLGYKCLWTREPGGPPISEKIREILLDNNNDEMLPETELLLYMASRAQHTGEWIKPALKRGEIVVCDRYIDSSYAYQGGGRMIASESIVKIGNYATLGLKPDLIILIDIEPELGLERIADKAHDRIEKETLDFHSRVRNHFLSVANSDKERYIVIDGSKDIMAVARAVREKVLSKIKDGG